VVGRYFELFQLLPRLASDIPCAEEYQPGGDDLNIPKDQTLDIVTWNIEWFGDEANSPASGNPNSDQIQKDSVKAIILSIDADIYAVEEIADDVLFAQLLNELPAYDYVLSEATSYPDNTGVKQKIGFIYKTSSISPVSTKVLLETVHPYYNGGNTSYLTDYPADADRFYASGRLPFMMTADVTINGATQQISFINIHARANSSNDPQLRYDMRKYDVEVLKDTLDTYYANTNFILLGDYNDDVDETVADIPSTVSSYEAYVSDAVNYDILTSILSDGGFRSYVFRENMIDHITVSDELSNKFIEGSSRVHYEFYDSDYASTTSDHLPVSTRLQLETLELVSTSTTDISCDGNEDGTANVEVKGGITPYTYEWSDGQTTQTATNLSSGKYTVTVSDALGATVSAIVSIDVAAPIILNMIDNQVVYVGYPEGACATLEATDIANGTPEYTYEWSTGETSETITVCPKESEIYSLTVTDANGCSATDVVVVRAEKVYCDTRGKVAKIRMCYNRRTKCVPLHLVDLFLQKGATIGICNGRVRKSSINLNDFTDNELIIEASAYPNPFTEMVTLNILSEMSGEFELLVYSTTGNLVHAESRSIAEGRTQVELELDQLKPGMYIVKVLGIDGVNLNVRIVKE